MTIDEAQLPEYGYCSVCARNIVPPELGGLTVADYVASHRAWDGQVRQLVDFLNGVKGAGWWHFCKVIASGLPKIRLTMLSEVVAAEVLQRRLNRGTAPDDGD